MNISNLNCIACAHTITPSDIEAGVCLACGMMFAFSTQHEAEQFASKYQNQPKSPFTSAGMSGVRVDGLLCL